ncbi:hypothetical protein FE236_11040 [Mariprofundus erugo]|uniref:hypothetical protein n=1 Tax=Mariprofundus erugo TaxID=2528639 RepID=UPI0010FD478C|nr:hypothetical protein [Mariprofundus erugo]TLS74820.1 hypothetical protein FE236_11040 [Mariprofundus erugo]
MGKSRDMWLGVKRPDGSSASYRFIHPLFDDFERLKPLIGETVTILSQSRLGLLITIDFGYHDWVMQVEHHGQIVSNYKDVREILELDKNDWIARNIMDVIVGIWAFLLLLVIWKKNKEPLKTMGSVL